MRKPRLSALWLLPLLLPPLVAPPSYAGVFFKKIKKPTPAERVPELLAQVKTDGDESKRAAAAQELRQYDPQQFPMIVPVLADVLLSDKKPAVRAEAAQSIGKLRPISQQAGMALEQALSNDASMRVRLQARSSLMQYHWNGYHNVRKEESGPSTKEPPLADDKTPPPPIISTTLPPRQPDGSRTTSGYRPPAPFPYPPSRTTTNEPPLAPASPPPRGGNESGPDLTPP
jgi:hypothetical protein